MKVFTTGAFSGKDVKPFKAPEKSKVGTWQKLIPLLLAFLFLSINATLYGQQPSASLEQVRNGSADAALTEVNWQNGNLGPTQAHYFEGSSVAYRAIMSDMPANTEVTLIMEYDVKHSGRHALDYLTNHQWIEPHELAFGHVAEAMDPTIGTSFSGGPDATGDIPAPPNTGSPVGDQPVSSWQLVYNAGGAFMSIWNGSDLEIDYPDPPGNGDLSLDNVAQQISVTFKTDAAGTVLLAWGGHIASRNDWGYDTSGIPLSAGGISGSPYHMRLISWNLNNLGNQDRSLKASAVIPPPECTSAELVVCEGAVGIEYSTEAINADFFPEYNWSIEGGDSNTKFEPAPTTASTSVFVTSGGQDYTVKLSVTSRFGNVSCTFPTVVNPKVTAGLGDDAEYCESDTALSSVDLFALLAGEDTGGTWTDASNATVISPLDMSGFTAGTTYTFKYTVTPTSPSECPADDEEVSIRIDETVTAGLGDDAEYCESDTALGSVDLFALLAGEDTGGTWTDASNATVISPLDMSGFTAGTTYTFKYTVTPTSPSECPADDEEVSIRIDPTPVVVATPVDESCVGLDGSISLNITVGTGPYTFDWADLDGEEVDDPDYPETQNRTGLAAGTYSVTVTDKNGCVGTASATVDPPSECAHLFPTGTTCQNYLEDAESFVLNEVCLTVENSSITNGTPGVFFYYGDFEATTSRTTIKVDQIVPAGLKAFSILNTNNVWVFDSNCNSQKLRVQVLKGEDAGDVKVTFNSTAGEQYIVSVKYDVKSLIGTPAPAGTANYQFGLEGQGTSYGSIAVKDCSAESLSSLTTSVKTAETIETSDVEIVQNDISVYPNPFSDVINIEYNINYQSDILIEIFDFGGNLLKTVTDQGVSSGSVTTINVDFSISANQMYLVRVKTDRDTFVKQTVSKQ